MPYIQGSNYYPLLINVTPNCHEVRSSRFLQSFPRVPGLVLFYVFFMSSASLTLSSSDTYQARALRALGILLADGASTVGGGMTF